MGRSGSGGEIRHLKVFSEDDAPLCACGEKGTLQAVPSGRGALNYSQLLASAEPLLFRKSLLHSICAEPKELTSVNASKAFRDDDQFTVNVIEECAKPSVAIPAPLHMSIGLDRFIIIGGFAFALGEKYLTILARVAQENCWNYPVNWNKMLQFGLNDDLSTVIGAGIMSSETSTR